MGACVAPIRNIFSTWGDKVIYTTFDEALFGATLPTNSQKIFYMWDLDWHCNGLDYETNLDLLQKSDKVFCRCQNHQAAIKEYFGVNAPIVENFNLKELCNDSNNECR